MWKMLAAALLLLSGCSATALPGPGTGAGPQVVASIYPLEYVADRVAGDHAEVAGLVVPGGDPHHAALTIAQRALIEEADLALLAAGLRPDVAAAAEASGTPTLQVTDVIDLQPREGRGHSHEEHGADHPAAEGHEPDLHFWQDPARMARVARALAERLATADPRHRADYRRNAHQLVTDLERLDRAYRHRLRTCEHTTVVVAHDAFGYLEQYGLRFVPIAGLSPGSVPTPADLARLTRLIEERGITTVFTEPMAGTGIARTLAQEAGVTVDVLDPLTGPLAASGDPGADYLSRMRANLSALRRAGEC